MILLIQNHDDYNNDLRAMLMAFYPGVKIATDAEAASDFDITLRVSYAETETFMTVCKHGDFCDKPDDLNPVAELPYYTDRLFISSCGYRARIVGDYRDRDDFRNILKMAAYRLIGQLADKRLPWGDLTGVRPTKIAMSALVRELGDNADGYNEDVRKSVAKRYEDIYGVSESKAYLAADVAARELSLIKGIDKEKDYCLYVGIPFCPSRCLYCSFASYPIDTYADRAEIYIDRLCRELDFIADRCRGRRLVSIYVGGGTPTSLDAGMLETFLNHIGETFCVDGLMEWTVEAGRPDSITAEKLAVMKKYGVTRISINPQTMNDRTLELIGRAHTSEQIKEAFAVARDAGFDNINMDIIAGLPNEKLSDMKHTLDEIRGLGPESITVHSLAIKRAAGLRTRLDEYGDAINRDMDAMHEAAREAAYSLGMKPYYLYRQKNIGGNLENIGYALDGCECLYNVLIMEEMTDIMAAGAGSATKLVGHGIKRVERVENCKSVDDYINRFDEMLDRKRLNIPMAKS